MKLTIDLPATTTDLRNYLDACELLGVETIADNETDGDGGLVVQLLADTASLAPPASVAEALPYAAKVAVPKAPAAKKASPKAGKRRGRGVPSDEYLAILRHLAAHGTFAGNGTALAKAAGLDIDDASKVVNRMQIAGDVTFTKNGQRIAAIAITNKGRERVGTTPSPAAPRPLASVPAARPAPAAPAAPAPVPPGGLKAPAGGWA